ncbi:BRO1-domain-containing protein [Lichtheimia hyalospora FSU 10163]|nr:BRO1-domain-containing protein [Lichtheimia hyalospora FSU 10163]
MASLLGASPLSSPTATKRSSESNMLSIDTKSTERVTWTPHLRKYISNGYAEHPDIYTDDFRVLDELRNDCIYMEANEKALNRLIKYYAQLVFIGSKFPIDASRIEEIRGDFSANIIVLHNDRLASNFLGIQHSQLATQV